MHSRSTAVLRPPTRPRSFCAQRPRAGSSRLRSAAAMSAEQEVLNANQALLSAIGAGDYNVRRIKAQ